MRITARRPCPIRSPVCLRANRNFGDKMRDVMILKFHSTVKHQLQVGIFVTPFPFLASGRQI